MICRKNCVGNPNCYCGLGEKAWMDKNLDEELKDALNESSKGGKRIPVSMVHFWVILCKFNQNLIKFALSLGYVMS